MSHPLPLHSCFVPLINIKQKTREVGLKIKKIIIIIVKIFPLPSVLTQHWLAHALQHGDLGRIIDPLLLLLLHPVTARVSIHYLYSLFDSKIVRKMSNAQASERKTSNDVKVHPKTEIGIATSDKQKNEKIKRKPGFTSENTRESDDSKTASPSGPSETEHSTDTDGDGAEADDENEESEPKKGAIY